jgi:hypothetical protein
MKFENYTAVQAFLENGVDNEASEVVLYFNFADKHSGTILLHDTAYDCVHAGDFNLNGPDSSSNYRCNVVLRNPTPHSRCGNLKLIDVAVQDISKELGRMIQPAPPQSYNLPGSSLFMRL